jgi:Chemoreceptor zinc-binding domain
MGFFNHLFNLDKFDALPLHPRISSLHSSDEMRLDADTVQMVLAEIDVDAAIHSHENWKEQLQSVLDGQPSYILPIDVACHDDRCELGKWLRGVGSHRFAQYPAFSALVSRHQDFHTEAAKVLTQAQSGDMDKARETLGGSYRQASSQVVLLLKELKRSLRH